jgi:probable rRNA maturation factor
MSISFIAESINFSMPNKMDVKKWIKETINNEQKRAGDISIVFCSDDYLLKVNNEFLKHDFYTDIITFDYCEDNLVSGDLMISIDRVKENAETQKGLFIDELHRVIIHGVLHLLGYHDKSKEDVRVMREKEDHYLKKRI